MPRQITNETRTRIVALSKEDISKLSLPLLAVVTPKELKKQELLALPAYWLQLVDPTTSALEQNLTPIIDILTEVLTESLLEDLWVSFTENLAPWEEKWKKAGFIQWSEKQFLPGVTDSSAHVVEEALSLQNMPLQFRVASGTIYLTSETKAFINSEYRLYHPVVERFQTHDLLSPQVNYFHFPTVLLDRTPAPETVDLNVSDEELLSISRTRILALTLDEMRAIKAYYVNSKTISERTKTKLTQWPTDAELEVIAQTWSEHCKHKIFNADISMQEIGSDNNIKNSNIKSLYKSYIQKATKELGNKRKDLLSVFKDNSGVVKWNDKFAICFKVETHNSPSALEPYGGALTGILGVNRDILGTGLGAKPIFNTDILCFAYPSEDLPKRPKLLPPQSIIEGVRQGIQDGGNNSGIPTVNGAIVFDPKYRAKPLVFCGTGGIMPLYVAGVCAYEKHTHPGDTIVMAGGRVGKDGIHGATFSSEALHEGSPVTAVQIGDPFTQKRLIDFILAARDAGLITGLTDNGAGGLSSSVGEMATITNGASINLDHVPTKYPGLAAWEMIISESQERMTLSTNNFSSLQTLAKKYNVEISAIGEFNTSGKFTVKHLDKTIVSLDLDFLHNGVPSLQLEAVWKKDKPSIKTKPSEKAMNISALLLELLAHPNICNREQVIRQYDHEVQGASVIKPLMGKNQLAACDAAVITPVLGEPTGLAISNGICPQLSSYDPYFMAQAALDEAIRNAVCVGADPKTISVLDNFCWPDPVTSSNNPDGAKYLGALVRTCQGLYDSALIMETPLISGKDSMKNDFDDGEIRLSIPPTLLISAIGKVPDINYCLSSEFKKEEDYIFLLSAGTLGLNGSVLSNILDCPDLLASIDLQKANILYQKLFESINNKLVNSAHDISDGGLLVNISESIIGSGLGANINLSALLENSSPYNRIATYFASQLALTKTLPAFLLFAEGPGQIVVTVSAKSKEQFLHHMKGQNVLLIGEVTNTNELTISTIDNKALYKWPTTALLKAWTTPLALS